jgi:hypothetical protein
MMRLLRMLGIVLGMLMAVGFGLCGAFGVIFSQGGVESHGFDPVSLVFGLAGLGIAAACAWAVWRTLKGKPDAGAPPAR